MTEEIFTAFCVRCKDKTEMIGPFENKTYDTKRGKKFIKHGFCKECGTKQVRTVKSFE